MHTHMLTSCTLTIGCTFRWIDVQSNIYDKTNIYNLLYLKISIQPYGMCAPCADGYHSTHRTNRINLSNKVSSGNGVCVLLAY